MQKETTNKEDSEKHLHVDDDADEEVSDSELSVGSFRFLLGFVILVIPLYKAI
jgi:hypothetical protein